MLDYSIGGEPISMFPVFAFVEMWAMPFIALGVMVLLVCLGNERANARIWRERYNELAEEGHPWQDECIFLRELLKDHVKRKQH